MTLTPLTPSPTRTHARPGEGESPVTKTVVLGTSLFPPGAVAERPVRRAFAHAHPVRVRPPRWAEVPENETQFRFLRRGKARRGWAGGHRRRAQKRFKPARKKMPKRGGVCEALVGENWRLRRREKLSAGGDCEAGPGGKPPCEGGSKNTTRGGASAGELCVSRFGGKCP